MAKLNPSSPLQKTSTLPAGYGDVCSAIVELVNSTQSWRFKHSSSKTKIAAGVATPAKLPTEASMGMVGDAYDNAMAESFFASLECELINRRSWQTKSQARLAVFTWIESWYNPLRRHSGINYKSPNNLEKALDDEEIESNKQTPESFSQEAQTVR